MAQRTLEADEHVEHNSAKRKSFKLHWAVQIVETDIIQVRILNLIIGPMLHSGSAISVRMVEACSIFGNRFCNGCMIPGGFDSGKLVNSLALSLNAMSLSLCGDYMNQVHKKFEWNSHFTKTSGPKREFKSACPR